MNDNMELLAQSEGLTTRLQAVNQAAEQFDALQQKSEKLILKLAGQTGDLRRKTEQVLSQLSEHGQVLEHLAGQLLGDLAAQMEALEQAAEQLQGEVQTHRTALNEALGEINGQLDAQDEALKETRQQLQEELAARRQDLQEKTVQLQNDVNAHNALLKEWMSRPVPVPHEKPAEKPAMREAASPAREMAVPAPASPAAPAPAPAASGMERRQLPRRRGNPVSVLVSNPAAGTEPFNGWIVDRSSGGFCLLVDEEVPKGTILSIRPATTRASARWIQVEVRNCRQDKANWKLGCQFVQKLSWVDLRMFG